MMVWKCLTHSFQIYMAIFGFHLGFRGQFFLAHPKQPSKQMRAAHLDTGNLHWWLGSGQMLSGDVPWFLKLSCICRMAEMSQ